MGSRDRATVCRTGARYGKPVLE
ncbi:hypothetical protein STPH1_1069 [Streptomyces sp. OM5714]|nr:hypothetical protein STPH1_1069 [Streptomyces sp. OM5714]